MAAPRCAQNKSIASPPEAISAADELITQLRAAADPLHQLAANSLCASRALIARMHERIEQLEAIARLNGETIRAMQQAWSIERRAAMREHGRRLTNIITLKE